MKAGILPLSASWRKGPHTRVARECGVDSPCGSRCRQTSAEICPARQNIIENRSFACGGSRPVLMLFVSAPRADLRHPRSRDDLFVFHYMHDRTAKMSYCQSWLHLPGDAMPALLFKEKNPLLLNWENRIHQSSDGNMLPPRTKRPAAEVPMCP